MLCWRRSKFLHKLAFSVLIAALPFKCLGALSYPEEGVWRPEKERDAIFRLSACPEDPKGDQLCGWLIGLDYKIEEGPPKDFSGRSECGLRILQNFKADDPNKPLKGRVFDPRSGKYYNALLWMKEPDILYLRGYLGLPLFGKTASWRRYRGPAVGANCKMQEGI